MRIHPRFWDDGTMRSFDISNGFFWSLGYMSKLLKSVDGVTDYRRHWFDDNRYSFKYRGTPCVVYEPYGDSDRYWIQPLHPDARVDLAPVSEAFRRFRLVLTFDREFTE